MTDIPQIFHNYHSYLLNLNKNIILYPPISPTPPHNKSTLKNFLSKLKSYHSLNLSQNNLIPSSPNNTHDFKLTQKSHRFYNSSIILLQQHPSKLLFVAGKQTQPLTFQNIKSIQINNDIIHINSIDQYLQLFDTTPFDDVLHNLQEHKHLLPPSTNPSSTSFKHSWKQHEYTHYKLIASPINFNKPIAPQLLPHTTIYKKHDGSNLSQTQRDALTNAIKTQFFKNFFIIHQTHGGKNISFVKLPYSRTTPKPHNHILPLFEDNQKLGQDLYKFKYAITLPSSKLSIPGGGSDATDPLASFNATRETLEESNIFLPIDPSFNLAKTNFDKTHRQFRTVGFYKFLPQNTLRSLTSLSQNPAFFGELQDIDIYPYNRKHVNGKTAALFANISAQRKKTSKKSPATN
jgi:hypothetical protein